MASTRQTNFSAGELHPYLHGRTDLPVHAKGLRTCLNYFISKEGVAVSRPGTTYVRNTKDAPVPRLVPFTYSDTDSYVLELGAGYIRFHRNGATVLTDGSLATSPSTGTPLEIVSPYAENHLFELQWAQVGSTLTITHPSYAPRTLTRDATGLVWTLATVSFELVDTAFVDLPSQASPTTSNPMLVDEGLTQELFFYDADHPPREWRYLVTSIVQEVSTGKTMETAPVPVTRFFDGTDPLSVANISTVSVENAVVLYLDRPVTLRRLAGTGGANPLLGTHTVVSYNFYRGRADLYGFVGTTKTLDFVDNGAEPDYAVQPPFETNPFVVSGAANENPIGVAFFQERRVWAGTDRRPTTILPSATGNYSDHDRHVLPVAGQALELELASLTRERARWAIGSRDLLIGTDANIWALGGTQSDVLDFDSVYARPIDSVGSTSLRPLVIGNTVVYVRTKGRGVRALVQSADGWQAEDITKNARHLFVGGEVTGVNGEYQLPNFGSTRQIVDWAYAEDPWGVAWVVRDDGVLLSMTIGAGGEVAWARHVTSGYVQAVCCVPEGTEDAVYLVVNRYDLAQGEVSFIERMTSRVQNDSAEDNAVVDSCLRFKTVPQVAYSGLDHLEGKEVWAVAVGNVPQGPYTVTGGAITLGELPTANDVNFPADSDPRVVMFIGLAFTADLEPLDYVPGAEGRVKQKTVTSVGFEVSQSRGLYFGQTWNKLTEWRQRTVFDSYSAPSAATDLVKVPVLGTHDFFARAVIRQTLPLPVTVLGIVREVSLGD